ncbi:MAG: DUF1177 domain-containing protein [Candidatus Pelethousia sp.]|nr:DUF1177 domain-containing protein [Candidatus Pelethousia sp.]
MFSQCMEIYDLLDSAYASGEAVQKLFAKRGVAVMLQNVQGEKGETTFLRMVIPGVNGKKNGGYAPTLGIVGRLGGLGARPDITGFVSDGDGALCVLAAGLKLADMLTNGDQLSGDVMLCTHICPNAPTVPHEPVRLMGSSVSDADVCRLETAYPVDALLSIDATKGNRILCSRGFAITPTVKEGYILRVSEGMLDIMTRVTGRLPVVLPITTQDITPYGNGIYHLNSIMQPSVMTDAPVVGVAITSEIPVAGCATGATQLVDVELAARFAVETAKDFTQGNCAFYNPQEFTRLQTLYGDMKHLRRK